MNTRLTERYMNFIPCNVHSLLLISFMIIIIIQAVLNVFDMASSDLHVHAMHLAIVHMHDGELVDKASAHLHFFLSLQNYALTYLPVLVSDYAPHVQVTTRDGVHNAY